MYRSVHNPSPCSYEYTLETALEDFNYYESKTSSYARNTYINLKIKVDECENDRGTNSFH